MLDLTLDQEPVRVRRTEVITGDVGHRTWSPEEKARILAEAAIPGVVVSESMPGAASISQNPVRSGRPNNHHRDGMVA